MQHIGVRMLVNRQTPHCIGSSPGVAVGAAAKRPDFCLGYERKRRIVPAIAPGCARTNSLAGRRGGVQRGSVQSALPLKITPHDRADSP